MKCDEMRETLNSSTPMNSSLPLNSYSPINPPKPDGAPRVTAIVVTHNGAGTIQTCIESLLGSSINPKKKSNPSEAEAARPQLRILIVDNASNDKTPSILERYASVGDIDLMRMEVNVGFGAGNNAGIRRALEQGTDYLFLLNQDAFVEVDTIEQLVGVMEMHPSFGVLSPLHLNGAADDLEWHFVEYGLKTTKDGRKWLETEEPRISGGRWMPCGMGAQPEMVDGRLTLVDNTPVPVEFVNAAAWMVRRSCFEEAGGFHPAFFMYSEDVEFLQRVHSLGFGVGVAVDCAVIHDRRENERRERRGAGLKNDPLRVHRGAVLSVALHPRYTSKEKRSAIRSKTIWFMARLIRHGEFGTAYRVWGATKEARNLMHSNVFEDARQSLFS